MKFLRQRKNVTGDTAEDPAADVPDADADAGTGYIKTHGAVWCSVVQCGAVWCRVVQCIVLQCAGVCCSVLQC